MDIPIQRVVDIHIQSRLYMSVDPLPSVEASGEVQRGEQMLYSGTDPESYITE